MTLAIMQPYFFPYIGYFQLMNKVDEFIVYDNIEFTRKGWINRNRILVNGIDSFITLPLKSDSDYLTIKERYLAENWNIESKKILNRIRESYRKAPHFNEIMPRIEEVFNFEEKNLFLFLLNSMIVIKQLLGISTNLVVSSTIEINHSLRSEDKVIALCKAREATSYYNPIGGLHLYDKDRFLRQGIQLFFLRSQERIYSQFNNQFIPWLSIIDVLMFNSIDEIEILLSSYLIE